MHTHEFIATRSTAYLKQSVTGLEVNFFVHFHSFGSKIFFNKQIGETTSKFSPFVWEKWKILTCKRLVVDIFLTYRLTKSLMFCKFAGINFEPCVTRI